MGSELATKWKSLSGENNWEGLLTPDLDVDLRNYLIHYGERAAAMGDAFNGETLSDGYGFSRYPPDGFFFANVGLEKGRPFKYEVTKFFYGRGTTILNKVEKNAWLGYVAVATDDGSKLLGRRDILIVWRGTSDSEVLEWILNFEALLTPASDILGVANNPRVHYGWHKIYLGKDEGNDDGEPNYNKTSVRQQVLNEVRRLVDKYKDEEISITVVGHSMGSAMATLNAMDIVANGYNKPTGKAVGCMVTAFAFASPRVGDEGFKKVFSELKDLHLLRITNLHDLVPLVPFTTLIFNYTHVGVELLFDTAISPYLNTPPDDKKENKYAHDLEVYLHGVAGTHEGINGGFKLVVDRDLALLSKHDGDFLKESRVKYHVPLIWGVEKNTNMVQQEDGAWKLNGYLPPLP